MADWSKPTLSSLYTDFLTEMKARDEDLAKQFDGVSLSNTPANAIRWNSSINRWQKWSGTAWGELASTYALTGLSTTGNASVGGTLTITGDGTSSLKAATATTPATSDSSTAVATTAFVKAQGYAPVDSPTFTGIPLAPTASLNTDSNQIATTKFTRNQISSDAVLLSGSTMTGSLTLSGNPTSPLHAATYQWVEGFPAKRTCRAATTANLTASATTTTLTNSGTLAALVIDGVSLTAGNRVLVKDQTLPKQNGIYEVTNAGSGSVAWVLTRTTDSDAWANIAGSIVSIEAGTTNINTQWYCAVATGGTLGTTAINWQLVSNSLLQAFGKLSSTGFTVRTGTDTISTRSIAVSGIGLSIADGNGISGNPTISSNATSAGTTADTIISRGTNGDYTAGTATLTGAKLGSSGLLVNDTIARTLTTTPIALIPIEQIAGLSQSDSALSISNYSTNASREPSLNLYKSISGSLGGNTAISNGAALGTLRFLGAGGGTSIWAGAEIVAQSTQLWTAATAGTKCVIRTTTEGATSPTDKFTVGQSGALFSPATYTAASSGRNVLVDSAGNIGTSASSIKYKKDIEDLEASIVDNAISNLRAVWYRSKNPSGDDFVFWSHIGLIAEEVDLVEPRLVRYRTKSVSYDKNGSAIIEPIDKPEPEDVDYARLSVLLLSEAQRQRKVIAELQEKVNNLIGQQ